MKYKSRRKIITILGLIPLVVLLFGIIGGVTYAIVNGTKSNTNHGVKVSVRGAVNVSASIKGTAYLNDSATTEAVLTTVEGETVTGTSDFSTPINIDTVEDKISYVFEITNTTTEAKYTDLIIEPVYTLNEAANVITTMYYSLDNNEYDVLTDKYLVAHKGGKMYVKLVVEVTEIGEAYSDQNGHVDFALYTEDGLPTDFEYDKTYSVDGTKAFVTEKCPTCGEKHKDAVAMEEGTYVIATPDNAQSVLDSDINGKVVLFTKSESGEKEFGALDIRITSSTLDKIYSYDFNDIESLENEIEREDLPTEGAGVYHYVRNLQNVKFIACDDVYFTGVFNIQSKTYTRKFGYFGEETTGFPGDLRPIVDPVRGVELNYSASHMPQEGDTAFTAHINVKNVSFEKMNFTGVNGRILIANVTSSETENVLIKNCSFTTSVNLKNMGAISMIYETTATFAGVERKNVKIVGCDIDGHYQGIRILKSENIVINNCTIKNAEHNLINLQGDVKGNIVINNNKIEGTVERAIRFLSLIDAKIVIEGNDFKNAVNTIDNETDLLKTGTNQLNAETNARSIIIMKNNTYNEIIAKDLIVNDEVIIINLTDLGIE